MIQSCLTLRPPCCRCCRLVGLALSLSGEGRLGHYFLAAFCSSCIILRLSRSLLVDSCLSSARLLSCLFCSFSARIVGALLSEWLLRLSSLLLSGIAVEFSFLLLPCTHRDPGLSIALLDSISNGELVTGSVCSIPVLLAPSSSPFA